MIRPPPRSTLTDTLFPSTDALPIYEMDRRVILGGIRLARRLLLTQPLSPYFEGEAFPGERIESDDELLDFARQRGTTAFHLMGTCRMGPATDPSAVVDDELRVHGLEGLRVADASIMPSTPYANTTPGALMRSEERRVGEECVGTCRYRGATN